MSNEDNGLGFTIGGDIAPLQQSLQAAEKAADATGLKVDAVNQKMTQGAQQAAQGWSGLTVKVDEAGKAAEKMGQEAKKAGEQTQQAGQQGAAGLRQVETEAKKAATSLEAMATLSKTLAGALAALGLGTAFHALVGDLETCTEAFGSFESTLNTVRGITSATDVEMKQLQATAIAMGQQTKFSANEAAQGMVRMARDGFDAQQIIEALPPVLNLAAAANTGVDQTARIAAGALRSFGLEAADMGKLCDILARATTASGSSLEDFGQTIKTAGPIARATGQSFLDVSTEIAILGKSMISASVAGTGIQSMLTRLAAPPKDCAKELDKLKLVINDTHGAMLPLNDIVDQLRQKMDGMTEAQKAATAKHIAGQYALKSLLTLVDAAPDAYDKMRAKLDENGAAARIAKTQIEGLAGAMKLASSSVETAEKVFGEKLAPTAILLANAIQKAADSVSSMPPFVLDLAAGIAVAGTAFLGLATVLAGFLAIAPMVVEGAALMGTGVGEVAIVIGVLSAALGIGAGSLASFSDQAHETSASVAEHKKLVNELADEYEALKNKTNPSTAEQQRMHAILLQLEKIAPEVTKGVDAMGHATDVDRQAISVWNGLAATRIGLLWDTVDAANAAKEALDRETAAAEAATKAANIQSHDRETGNRITEVDKQIQDINNMPPGERRQEQGRLASLLEERKQLQGVRLANRKAILTSSQENAKAQKAAGHRPYHAPTPKPKPQHGAPFHYTPTGGGRHRTAKAKPTDAGAAHEINADAQQAIQLEEAKAKVADATRAREIQKDKDAADQQLAVLKDKLDKGQIHQREYLTQFEALKKHEIELAMQAESAKLEEETRLTGLRIQIEREAAQKAREAADKERDPKTRQRDLDAAKAADAKADAGEEHLKELTQKRIGVVDHAEAQIQQLHAETSVKIQAADRADTIFSLEQATKRQRAIEDGQMLEREASIERLNGIEKDMAAAELAYDKEERAAQRAYEDERTAAKNNQKLSEAERTAAINAADKKRQGALAKATADHGTATAAIRTKWVAALKDIGSTLTELFANPSPEKLADLLGDPGKLQDWVTSIKNLPTMFGDASAGLSALQAGAEASATQLVAMGGTAGIVLGLGAAFVKFASQVDPATQAIKDYKAALQDLQDRVDAGILTPEEAADANVQRAASHRDDVFTKLQAARANLKTSLDQQKVAAADPANLGGMLTTANANVAAYSEQIASLSGLLEGAKADLKAAKEAVEKNKPADLVNEDGKPVGSEAVGVKLQSTLAAIDGKVEAGLMKPADAVTERVNALKGALGELIERKDELGKEAHYQPLVDSIKAQIKPLEAVADQYTAIQQHASELTDTLTDAAAKMRDAQEAIDTAQKSLDTDGRDEDGKHITLEAERALRIKAENNQYQEQNNQLLDQKKKLLEEITQIEVDRAKAVQDIENEGIAQRAKTEFLDKTERIAKVNEDAAKKTKDLTDQVDKANSDINNLLTQHEHQANTINNQYADRIGLLNTEIEKQTRLFQIEQQRAALAVHAIASGAPAANMNTDQTLGGGGNLVWENAIDEHGQTYGHFVESRGKLVQVGGAGSSPSSNGSHVMTDAEARAFDQSHSPNPGVGAPPVQPIQPGNIDLDHRPIAHNADGSISTVRSISVSFDDGVYLLPTVVNGAVVSNDDAIAYFRQTHQHLGVFRNEDDAEAYADWLHREQEAFYVERHHVGGTAGAARRVRGAPGADVPTVLQAGEFVLTAPQMTYLLQASAGGQAGSVTFGEVHIHTQAVSSQQIARDALRELGRMVAQKGGHRIL